jgi:signal transduction histidine kinase
MRLTLLRIRLLAALLLVACAAVTALQIEFSARSLDWRDHVTFVVLAGAAALSEIFVVRGPKGQLYVFGEIFCVAAAILLPVSLLALFPVALVVAERRGRTLREFDTTIAVYASVFLAISAAAALGNGIGLSLKEPGWRQVLAVTAVGVAYVFANQLIIAAVGWAKTGRPRVYPAALGHEFLFAALGCAFAILWRVNPVFASLALAPIPFFDSILRLPALEADAAERERLLELERQKVQHQKETAEVRKQHHELAAELLEVQRRESLVTLAGGVAHDFNNLLTGVIGYAELASRETERGSQLQIALNGILGAANSAAALSQQMLAYSGHGTVTRSAVNVAEMIEGLASILEGLVDDDTTLRYELGPVSDVDGDATQLSQIVISLVVNAGEALRGEGSVTVATSDEPGGVLLTVRDTGPGIAAHIQDSVFEPFASTKFQGRGLGLAAAEGLVRSHGGTISFDTSDEGTTFKVLLPYRQAEEASPVEEGAGMEARASELSVRRAGQPPGA